MNVFPMIMSVKLEVLGMDFHVLDFTENGEPGTGKHNDPKIYFVPRLVSLLEATGAGGRTANGFSGRFSKCIAFNFSIRACVKGWERKYPSRVSIAT